MPADLRLSPPGTVGLEWARCSADKSPLSGLRLCLEVGLWGSSPNPGPCVSCGVGGVIMRKLGTAGPPTPDAACELEPPVLKDRVLATLELRLVDRAWCWLLSWWLLLSDLGGDREKSMGDVPKRLEESSLWMLSV